MAGVKGRSGRPKGTASMAQQKASRVAAKRDGGKATSGSSACVVVDDPEVIARMEALDIDPPTTWAEARTMEQYRAESYRTIQASVLLAQERGRLVARSDMRAAVELMRDTLYRHTQRVPNAVVKKLKWLRPEQRATIKAEVEECLREAYAGAAAEAQA